MKDIDELNTAIAINDINTIHELLINNIDVNTPDSHGVFPVMYAVEYGNANALITTLLKNNYKRLPRLFYEYTIN